MLRVSSICQNDGFSSQKMLVSKFPFSLVLLFCGCTVMVQWVRFRNKYRPTTFPPWMPHQKTTLNGRLHSSCITHRFPMSQKRWFYLITDRQRLKCVPSPIPLSSFRRVHTNCFLQAIAFVFVALCTEVSWSVPRKFTVKTIYWCPILWPIVECLRILLKICNHCNDIFC